MKYIKGLKQFLLLPLFSIVFELIFVFIAFISKSTAADDDCILNLAIKWSAIRFNNPMQNILEVIFNLIFSVVSIIIIICIFEIYFRKRKLFQKIKKILILPLWLPYNSMIYTLTHLLYFSVISIFANDYKENFLFYFLSFFCAIIIIQIFIFVFKYLITRYKVNLMIRIIGYTIISTYLFISIFIPLFKIVKGFDIQKDTSRSYLGYTKNPDKENEYLSIESTLICVYSCDEKLKWVYIKYLGEDDFEDVEISWIDDLNDWWDGKGINHYEVKKVEWDDDKLTIHLDDDSVLTYTIP